MQFSPKLKKAMEQIKVILEEHDIAASVILHTPGHSEYFNKINPSYSCVSFEGEKLKIQARLTEDFNGNKETLKETISNTSNMLKLLSDVTGRMSLSFFEISDELAEVVSSQHFYGGHSTQTTQNH